MVPPPPPPLPIWTGTAFVDDECFAMLQKRILGLSRKHFDSYINGMQDHLKRPLLRLKASGKYVYTRLRDPSPTFPMALPVTTLLDGDFVAVPAFAKVLQMESESLFQHHMKSPSYEGCLQVRATLKRLRNKQFHFYTYTSAQKHLTTEANAHHVVDMATYTAYRLSSPWLKKVFPAKPRDCYRNKGFTTFDIFCGAYCFTYEETKKRVWKLGATCQESYAELRNDKRMPVRPDQAYYYSGWKGWDHFLFVPASMRPPEPRKKIRFDDPALLADN